MRSDVKGFQWAVFFTFIRTLIVFWAGIGVLISFDTSSLFVFLFITALPLVFIWIALFQAYYSKIWAVLLLLLSAWSLLAAIIDFSVIGALLTLPYFLYGYHCVYDGMTNK